MMKKRKKKKKKGNNKPIKILTVTSRIKSEPTALPMIELHLSPEDRQELHAARRLHLSTVAHWPKPSRDRARQKDDRISPWDD